MNEVDWFVDILINGDVINPNQLAGSVSEHKGFNFISNPEHEIWSRVDHPKLNWVS